ncbi:MBL fold metallo-hydrolase [Thauera linaloolentis]|uniref:Beta-lactamase n=1 Tax=Thauera linaloolentis (strain DSM 12138 / JCM 21573 / CCUG 41526 / CIP 105981 / IAM 15112 / NBRC 102519 / 47Lol) TaxID=1123367 RepID=N6Y9P9_THAL4|nr:MBL fold metallo-hydrolase [Thauera linaloolentis]ENO88245.1 beta-lactamase [Thauera linaloolentis 47Lol = DSM 12138]MCM8566838.1 MBL fold metallo-hydrolase [Thauera linaloolentis]
MPQLHYPFPELPAEAATIQVADGVHWVRMPLPFALDHINLWLLDDGGERVIVDAGYGSEQTRAAWASLLDNDARAVTRVVVTHHHPDHLGLASWLAARDGASVHMSLGEYLTGKAIWHQSPGYGAPDMVAQFRAHGLDEARAAALAARGNAYRHGVPEIPAHYERLRHGSTLSIGGRQWRVIVGYGHAPEHASLYCGELGVLISGDMLLPRISTNVSVHAATPHDDALGDFLDAIRELCNLPDDTLVLPSHGKPFKGIRSRVEQLVAHHRERCAALQAECGTARTAADLLTTLFPRELDTHQVMFAMGEAIAHLNYLEKRGALRREVGADGLARFVNINQ